MSTTGSPTRSRRTATAWCASSPSTTTTWPGRDARPATGTRWTRQRHQTLKASRNRLNTDLCAARTEPVGRLLAADRGQLAQQLLLARVEPGRGLDQHGDDQVAATAAQPGDAAAAQHLLGAGLGARPDLELEAGLQVGRRRSPSARSASSVGRVSVVPSAAAVIGTETVQCRSVPCRVNVSCGATWIST